MALTSKKNPARFKHAGSPTSYQIEAGGPSQGEVLAAKSRPVRVRRADRGPAMNQENMIPPDRKPKRDLVHSTCTRWPGGGEEHGSVTAPESWRQQLPPHPFRKPFALAHAGANTEPTTGIVAAPTTSPTTP